MSRTLHVGSLSLARQTAIASGVQVNRLYAETLWQKVPQAEFSGVGTLWTLAGGRWQPMRPAPKWSTQANSGYGFTGHPLPPATSIAIPRSAPSTPIPVLFRFGSLSYMGSLAISFYAGTRLFHGAYIERLSDSGDASVSANTAHQFYIAPFVPLDSEKGKTVLIQAIYDSHVVGGIEYGRDVTRPTLEAL
jgi:hypothetical protein